MGTREGRATRWGGPAEKKPGSTSGERAVRITAETPYGECAERLTACGGLWALVTCVDLLGFEQAVAEHDMHPRRKPKGGGHRMGLGILMLLVSGLQRLEHFGYVQDDARVCGMLRVAALPAVRALALDGAVGGAAAGERGAAGDGVGLVRVSAARGDGAYRHDGEHRVRGD